MNKQRKSDKLYCPLTLVGIGLLEIGSELELKTSLKLLKLARVIASIMQKTRVKAL